MVTAYFLGLKRTYKIALRLQRRIVGPKHPKIRSFLQRRTRAVFDVALKVHSSIQQRDIEVGKNLGNWILRWLDRMKPSANIRGQPSGKLPTSNNVIKHVLKPTQSEGPARSNIKIADRESGTRLFSQMNVRPISFPTLSMMRPSNAANLNSQYRHIYSTTVIPNLSYRSGRYESVIMPNLSSRSGRYEGVFRKDIMQWMLQN